MIGRVRVAALALSVSLLASSCGQEQDRSGASAVRRSAVLTQESVARLPAGSPEKALAAWWRALQTANVNGARRLLPKGSEKRLEPGLPLLFVVTKPVTLRLVEVERAGRRAVVYAELVAFRPIGSRRRVELTSVPQGFPMVEDRAGWRLSDGYFFDRIGTALVRAARTGT